MNQTEINLALTYDDVLIAPSYGVIDRVDVDLSVELGNSIKLKLPIISAPMDTVTEAVLASKLGELGGLGVIHRNFSVDEEAAEVKKVVKGVPKCAAVGIGSDFDARVASLVESGTQIICIDSAHGHTRLMGDSIRKLKSSYPGVLVMAGAVATVEGAALLAEAGVDLIKVGVGPGSICTTRIVSGVGVPQLTAVMESRRGVEGSNAKIIADGGIKQLGDIAKAIGAGAHLVMMGSMFAGFAESAGEIVEVDGKQFKSYRGMGSVAAMVKGSASRYGQAGLDTAKLVPEGVEGLVPLKGSLEDFISQIEGALRSSFFYVGAANIEEFQQKAKFWQISNAGLVESKPHSLTVTNFGSSYLNK
jgi:IMP dehydrogenase